MIHPNVPLIFQPEIAKHKPENIRHPHNYCPFCDTAHLTNILNQEGDKIWLVNKYRTLKDTYQTVLIESANHNGDASNYSVAENRSIFAFANQCWHNLIDTGAYRSVLLYKNFGPMSGGSLKHPHFQIVGLTHKDGYQDITPDNFEGLTVFQEPGFTLNLSTYPIVGFLEFNLIIADPAQITKLADTAQVVIKYILNDYFHGICDSYNLFFYDFNDQIICKIIPRFVMSPYFVGYKIPQLNDEQRLLEIKKALLAKLTQ
ncbi:MAG: DUF4931 domain-containing protein [Lactobacillus sp.]|nr:DUF4931 domain-containing protein [Lactobacillus sp.]